MKELSAHPAQDHWLRGAGGSPGPYLSDECRREQDLGEDRCDGENRHLEILHLQSPVVRYGPVPLQTSCCNAAIPSNSVLYCNRNENNIRCSLCNRLICDLLSLHSRDTLLHIFGGAKWGRASRFGAAF